MAEVEVKPLPVTRWHGKSGKDSITQPVRFEVLYDGKTGRYATGLTKEEAEEYSKLLGGVDLSDGFSADKPHPYWSTQAASMKLPNHTVILHTERPADFVKWKNLKASNQIANSLKEWQDGKYPFATHYIHNEEEEIEIKATKVQRKLECVRLMSTMSPDEMASLLQIVGGTSARNKSPKFILTSMDELIEQKPDEFIRWAKQDKAEVYLRATVLEALHRGILTKEGTAVYYMSDRIANDVDEAVAWFSHPDNQKQKAVILGKLTV